MFLETQVPLQEAWLWMDDAFVLRTGHHDEAGFVGDREQLWVCTCARRDHEQACLFLPSCMRVGGPRPPAELGCVVLASGR